MIKKLSDDTFFMYQGDTGTLTGSVIDVAPGIDPDTFTEITPIAFAKAVSVVNTVTTTVSGTVNTKAQN